MIPVAAAVVVGGVAWIGVGPMLSGGDDDGPAPAPQAEPEVEVVVAEPSATPGADRHPREEVYPTVLVARNDIQPGVLLRADLVEWREWQGALDMSLAVVQDVVPLRAVLGAVTQRRFREGELVAWDGLLTPGHPGFTSAALEPGMRGVTIEVDRATTDANIIHPGDRVDVIMISPAPDQEGGPAARTIIRDARVLAVGSTVLSIGRYGRVSLTQAGLVEPVPPPDGRNYTLEVVPADAERIAVATDTGRLTLAMRSIRATAAETDGRAVRLDQVMPPEEPPEDPPRVRVMRGAQQTAVVLDHT
ncbi:MAG: Flp pilus assembly protein CpaB [Gammaproteobacteria bacterium]|nr:Flp pilus assembly protein CpaB [Gammaproteobacteria bacterium]